MTETVEVFAGRCTLADGELHVSHSVWRAVHPFMMFAVLVFLALTVDLFVRGPVTDGGRRYHWYHMVALSLLVVGLVGYDLATHEVVFDKRIPVADIEGVRLETEQRRGYLRRQHAVPLVVVEYAADGGTATYPIHLHRRQMLYEPEVLGLLELFKIAGVPVADEAGWLVTDDESVPVADVDLEAGA